MRKSFVENAKLLQGGNMSFFNKSKTIYLDNADSFSFKENLGKELTFPRKVKSKSYALSNNYGGYNGYF